VAAQRSLAHLVCDRFGCHSGGRIRCVDRCRQRPRPQRVLRTALSAFRNWRREMLAFFDFLPTRLSNGFVEGKNNRTKALLRQGYGYRNRRHLRLRILLEVA
jgi:transposase